VSDDGQLSEGCVGCIWVALHGCALLFFFPALFVTVPLHLIYALQQGKSK